MWCRASWKPIKTQFTHSDISGWVPALNKSKKYWAVLALGQFILAEFIQINIWVHTRKYQPGSHEMGTGQQKEMIHEWNERLSSAETPFKKRILKYSLGVAQSYGSSSEPTWPIYKILQLCGRFCWVFSRPLKILKYLNIPEDPCFLFSFWMLGWA